MPVRLRVAEPLEPDEIEVEASGMAHVETAAGELTVLSQGLQQARLRPHARGEVWNRYGDIETVLEALNADAVHRSDAEGRAVNCGMI